MAAVVFLIVYAWQVLGELEGSASNAADVILTITWVMFAIDYVARLVLAQRRWSWFGRHLLDLAIVALPILRPLRLVRLVVLLAIFQRVAGRTLRGRVVVYIAGSTILLIFVTALAVLDAERHEAGASIQKFVDALWWAFATITTVGYGDVTPISLTGRAIAVVLMIGGIALLGTVTATLASWIVQRVAEEDVANQASTRRQVEMLTQKLEQMQLRPEWARPPANPGDAAVRGSHHELASSGVVDGPLNRALLGYSRLRTPPLRRSVQVVDPLDADSPAFRFDVTLD